MIFFFFLYLIWILATFVRKKHSLRRRQPKLCSCFVDDVSKRFAEAALRHPSSLLAPERVARLNFSWCKTSDCNWTSAIRPFKAELWTVFREKNHITAYKRELPPQWCFEQEKIITHISVEVFISDLKTTEEKLLLDPPVKINLPGLRVMRKCKAEISTAIKETRPRPKRPAFCPLSCTDP